MDFNQSSFISKLAAKTVQRRRVAGVVAAYALGPRNRG